MPVITAANLNAQIDAVVRAFILATGSASIGASKANNFGLGELSGSYGAYDAIADGATLLTAIGDADVQSALLPAAVAFRDSLSTLAIFGAKARGYLAMLDRHAARFGGSNYSSLETYLTYLNTGTGTKWQGLQDYKFRDLYYAVKSAYPSVCNLYYEVLQGTTDAEAHLSTDALGKFVASGAGTGAFTDGVAIDSTKYAGGFGKLKVSGLTGTGNVTVTGNFYDPATKTVQTAKTAITNVTANGTVTMTVGAGTAPTDFLILDVTNVTIAAGISAGTIYVEAHRPTGRSLLPA